MGVRVMTLFQRSDIGRVRTYERPERPTIYPGEVAEAILSIGTTRAMLHKAIVERQAELPVDRWIVRPDRGLWAWYRRWRYRVLGASADDEPKLRVSIQSKSG